MTIVQTESMIVITARDGRTTRLSPDGKKIKDESTNIERKTRWEEGKLVSEISGTAGRATETYSVNPTQHELLVVVRLSRQDAMKPSACSIVSTRSTHTEHQLPTPNSNSQVGNWELEIGSWELTAIT